VINAVELQHPVANARRNTAAMVSLSVVAVTVLILCAEGRRWWCACTQPWPSIQNVWSQHCSQHLFDPYSLTHMEHGLILFSLLAWLRPGWSVEWRLCAAVSCACGWEVLENSPFIIARYRASTMSLNYLGDSIVNSLGDIVSCVAGFFIARKLGLRTTLALFVATELLLLLLIRDNLIINIVMLLHPIEGLKTWQMSVR
jgi:hypothetical protein